MPTPQYSPHAELDLEDIGAYTTRVWSETQADKYLDSLQSHCQQLALNPTRSRPCSYLYPNLRRSEHGKHVIFFRQTATGILVSRILHQSMLPGEHDLEQQP